MATYQDGFKAGYQAGLKAAQQQVQNRLKTQRPVKVEVGNDAAWLRYGMTRGFQEAAAEIEKLPMPEQIEEPQQDAE